MDDNLEDIPEDSDLNERGYLKHTNKKFPKPFFIKEEKKMK